MRNPIEMTKVFEKYPLETLINYIDWTPFFITWQLAGKYPDILSDRTVGKAATDLFSDAQKLLRKIIEEKSKRINLAGYPSGVYNMTIIHDKMRFNKRVIKQ